MLYFATLTLKADAGIMITGSHNPPTHNGFKMMLGKAAFFGAAIQELGKIAADGAYASGAAGAVGERSVFDSYVERLAVAIGDGARPRGRPLTVAWDAGNGAAGRAMTALTARLPGRHILLNETIDGRFPAHHPDPTVAENLVQLQAAVREHKCDLGFAFDGDADRVLAVDADGRLIDGDQLIALSAVDLRERGLLSRDTVVVTVMSNLGFRRGMEAAGISVVETAVGDRYVLEALDAGGYSLGGEQSGHLIFRDRATTGDGLLSALLVADVVVRRGQSLAALADAAMARLPQVLRNVALARRPADLAERLIALTAEASAELGADGRVLLRPSGTEPVVRVMVEALDDAVAAALAARLSASVEALGDR
jgi:phosphoglucosamine mutase